MTCRLDRPIHSYQKKPSRSSTLVYFFAIEFPTARVTSGIARQLSQFSHKRITIRFAGELLQVFAHKLIHALAHSFCAAPGLLEDFIINRQRQIHYEIIRAHVLRVNMLSEAVDPANRLFHRLSYSGDWAYLQANQSLKHHS